jgi:eukaryotic-like serine/threonine-protein kinase
MLRMELAEGVILDGHYRLRQLLGRGGMGEVWEAEHTRLPKHFALKFLLALSKAEPELLMRFRREAEIASRLLHPSIVQVTDFNILPDGTAYIAMERLLGEDLRARLGRGPLTLAEAREITRQVASALQLAHEAGVVHRDLKPENIFLCREPDGGLRAKVLDFGISKLQQSAAAGAPSTRDDRVLGTPGYMAPEQALGKNSSIDGRTDLFALATIVYEMLTGHGVFKGDTLAELCTKVLYHTPPPLDEVLPAVPRSLAVAVSQALSKDPALRQSNIRAFADAVAGERVEPVSSARAEAAFGFSATVASDAAASPSLAARALAAGPDARDLALVDASDAITRSARPSEPAASQPAHPGKKRVIAAAATIVALLVTIAALIHARQAQEPHASPLAVPVVVAPPGRAPTPELARQAAGQAGDPAQATGRPATSAEPDVGPSAGEGLAGAPYPAHDGEPGSPAGAAPEGTRDLAARNDPGSLRKAGESAGRPVAAEPERALSASASAALDEAERALRQGDLSNALRLARTSLREASSERAYVVMARAYCAQHDVGMLQAMLRNLSPARKKQVLRDCPP